jgi:alpha-L-fucosidase 2
MKTQILMKQPAVRWEEAFPVGNGSVGALVHGNIAMERLVLNHEALWLPAPKPRLPDISEHLAELRRLLHAGQFVEADEFLHRKLVEAGCSPPFPTAYHPACDLNVAMAVAAAPTDYREVHVRWSIAGLRFERSVFVSRTDGMVVLRQTCDRPGAVDLLATLAPHPFVQRIGMGFVGSPEPDPFPIVFDPVCAEGRELRFRARYRAGGCGFGAAAHVRASGGEVSAEAGNISVRSADVVEVLVKVFPGEDLEALEEAALAELTSADAYEDLRERHAAAHAELFERLDLRLPDTGCEVEPNEALQLRPDDPSAVSELLQRQFALGRHLLISSSAPGGWPTNLQGVWNGDYQPAWSADYHNDENIQMCYWAALPGGLPECALAYFDYYESFLDDYRENARKVYGCRGIAATLCQSTHGMVIYGPWLNWTAAAGWLAQLFFDYWLYTGDRTFLEERAFPFMREVALFYEDFLYPGDDGKLVFAPSLSPENRPQLAEGKMRRTSGHDIDNLMPESGLATINATMDIAIAREVLTNLLTTCEALGCEDREATRWRALLAALPDYAINEDGALSEWVHPVLRDNYRHRHLSHLYPVFPGFDVRPESRPDLFQAARVALEKRLVIGLAAQSGWSLAHMANAWARLGEGGRALECLTLLSQHCTLPNGLTTHNDWRAQGVTLFAGYDKAVPFQIDANLGLVSAVLEMLVGSEPGMLRILPALPATWATGSLRGAHARGQLSIDLDWDMEAGHVELTIRSTVAQALCLCFPREVRRVDVRSGTEPQASPLGPVYREVSVGPDEPLSFCASL